MTATAPKRLNDLGKGKQEAPKIDPLNVIIRPGNNYRDMTTEIVRAHIDWLKTSILEEGVKNPIDVEFDEGKVYLIAGECRLTAAQELRREGWDGRIPARTVKGDEAQVLAGSMVDNGGLTPSILEFGNGVQRLVNYGWPLNKVAKYIPASVADSPAKALKFVKDALELHHAPMAVKEAVAHGVEGVTVTPAAALSETRKGRTGAAERITENAKAAKAKGKKTLKRAKIDGKATKAKKQATTALEVADQIASLVISTDHPEWDKLEALAKKYLRLRK